MMLYPENQARLNLGLFRHPSAAYRGVPFWAWNTRLERGQLLRQIEVLEAMGMGGFHIHSRTGLDTPYLGDEFMTLVQECVEQAQSKGLRAWLYDEDRWPSGAAGGLVTKDERYRAKHLLWTTQPYDGTAGIASLDASARATRSGNGVLLHRYYVELVQGRLERHRLLAPDEAAPQTGRVWYAYLETALPSPWFNNQTYVDTLNREATQRFLELTHERYAETVGKHFGTTIPAMFTDEPQFVHKQCFQKAEDTRDLIVPWTTDFFESFVQQYGSRLEPHLPELFWERADGAASIHRYRYHDHLAERFASSFADTVGDWCQNHGLMLTGHMMEEPTLESQTSALGEAMRSYRAFHLPGIDILCDQHEYTTAKQAQSAAHQFGRPGMLSELYGVTNWNFDFRGHKAQGDWQAALGVTVRVHHLAWVSMAGEAKRDYPASISYQSPWHLEYPLVENHFARLNTVLTRGQACVRIGVIHPIESYWLCFGPLEQTRVEREEREWQFKHLTEWLLFGLQDFDFIAESLLPDLCLNAGQVPLEVGQARYDVIIVPNLHTLRYSTFERLEAFQKAGGTVLFMGEIPSLVDALPSERVLELARLCPQIPFSEEPLLEALRPWREVSAWLEDGRRADSILHQIRRDGTDRFVFFCNTDRNHARLAVRIGVQGHSKMRHLDTLTGETRSVEVSFEHGCTVLNWDFPAHGHLLLQLEPDSSAGVTVQHPQLARAETVSPEHYLPKLTGPVPITLSEPNVLLLDRAEYRLDDEDWQPAEELLRMDNLLRRRLGWALQMDAVAQPWTSMHKGESTHKVSLRFTLESEVAVSACLLALEGVQRTTLCLDGQPLANTVTGWWVDEAIQTCALPALEPGVHHLELQVLYTPRTSLEWCYLLGDFGVRVQGALTHLTAPVRQLCFGDWSVQGLPFYAGNVTYHCPLEGNDESLTLEVADFHAPLLSIALDGTDMGRIAFAPYQLELGRVERGTHTLHITAFGNRVNAFGAVHNANPNATWYGPNLWRTTGDAWSDGYQLKVVGIQGAPRLWHSKVSMGLKEVQLTK